jgi:hypothetical protein
LQSEYLLKELYQEVIFYSLYFFKQVQSVDYGMSWDAKVSYLRQCQEKYKSIPFQAFKFRLADLDQQNTCSDQQKTKVCEFVRESTMKKLVRAFIV